MKQLVIATTNKNKLIEYKAMLPNIQILSLLDFPQLEDVEETATTFEGNARLKAETISKELNLPVIADDSGLCVDALNGAPGVYSARYAGNHDNVANNKKLLHEMNGKTNRQAHYVTVLAYAQPGKDTKYFKGEFHGTIATKESSTPGFGYDTIFLTQDGQYLSEVKNKNEISHRRLAMNAFVKSQK